MGTSMNTKCNKCNYEKEHFTGCGFSSFRNLTDEELNKFATRNKLSEQELKIIKDIPVNFRDVRGGIENTQLFYCDCDKQIVLKRFTEINHPDFPLENADEETGEIIRPDFAKWTAHIFTVDYKNIMVGNLTCSKCQKTLKFANKKKTYICPKCNTKDALLVEPGSTLWD